MKKKGKIKYLASYNTPNGFQDRYRAPAACAVVDYVVDVIDKEGFEVELLSASNTLKNKSYKGSKIPLSSNKTLIYFRAFKRGGWLRNKFSTFCYYTNLFFKLLFTVNKRDTLIVYHSLPLCPLVSVLKKIKKFRLILSIQEIYGDVTNDKKTIKKELRFFKNADAYIFPTNLLNEKINKKNKPYVLVHGTYNVEKQIVQDKKSEAIHCVYAGTFDVRKGGGAAAVAAAEFLDQKYHIHILGFGTEEEKKLLITQIEAISKKTKCKLTFDGLLSGEDYIRFLQGCDIGLSTQNPNASFNDSSFPSKVLSYMANGLRVVSIKIAALETSYVNEMLYYYKEDSPKAIAEAIRLIDVKQPYDGRKKIKELDEQFRRELKELLIAK